MEDILFLKYMGEKGNELQQKSFVKALGIEIEGKIIATNTKMPPDKMDGKKSELDVRIQTSCCKDINIEVQRAKTIDFIERLITYQCKRAIEPTAKGKNYKRIKKVITIAICKKSFLKSPLYHNTFHIKNRNIYINEKLIDKIEIHIIEMEKFRKPTIYEEDPNQNNTIIKTKKDLKNNRKHQYLKFIDDETTHEERKEIVKMGDEGLEASMKCLELALQNGAFDEYFYQKLNEAHQENIINEEIEKGIKIKEEKIKKEGKIEEKEKICIKLKNKGIPIEIISETTGLSISKIKKL
jgi:predicted transposase/invertase (TIGR01784 family)